MQIVLRKKKLSLWEWVYNLCNKIDYTYFNLKTRRHSLLSSAVFLDHGYDIDYLTTDRQNVDLGVI